VGSLAAIAATLELISATGLVSRFLMPPPSAVAASFKRLFVHNDLFHYFLVSAGEVFMAATLAIALGAAGGWLLYVRPVAWRAFTSWIVALNATPVLLLFPLFLVIFGRGKFTIVALAVTSGLPPIIVKTREAFATVRPVLIEVGRSFNLDPVRQFWLIELPAAAPVIVGGIRVGVFYTLSAVIGLEFLTGFGGLGALIPDLAERYDLAAMYGAILFVILMSVTFLSLIKRVERWLKPY
jgi:ABC-type nitrate/sulfonate/bicarbonate transport system permease component